MKESLSYVPIISFIELHATTEKLIKKQMLRNAVAESFK